MLSFSIEYPQHESAIVGLCPQDLLLELFREYIGLTEKADPGNLVWRNDEDVVANLVEVERQSKGMRGRKDRDGLQLIVENTQFALSGQTEQVLPAFALKPNLGVC